MSSYNNPSLADKCYHKSDSWSNADTIVVLSRKTLGSIEPQLSLQLSAMHSSYLHLQRPSFGDNMKLNTSIESGCLLLLDSFELLCNHSSRP